MPHGSGKRAGHPRIACAWIVARLAIVSLVLVSSLGCQGGFFRQYEYEEEMYPSLDGTATIYVNTSLLALNALRGTSFDPNPDATVDRAGVRDFFTTPITHVSGSVAISKRGGRRFVHVRVDVDDIRRLSETRPFAWSTYRFNRDNGLFVFLQKTGPSATTAPPASANWNGKELVAYRLHVPSKIRYHNGGPTNPRRGNILVWEQSLADRLKGEPLEMEARMDPESILYRTLWLFGVTFVAVVITFVLVIWWVLRRGAPMGPASGGGRQSAHAARG